MATLLLRNAYSARDTAVWFDGEAGEDPLNQGPVWVTRTVDSTEERLGEADTLRQAILSWPELLEIGDKIEITVAGVYDYLVGENLPFSFGPPAAWPDGKLDPGGVSSNGEWLELDEIMDDPWEQLAIIEGTYGYVDVSRCGNWFRDGMGDCDPTYYWDPEAKSEEVAANLFSSPPMWPGGDDLEASSVLPDDPETVARIIERAGAKDFYSSIEVNGTETWRKEDTD